MIKPALTHAFRLSAAALSLALLSACGSLLPTPAAQPQRYSLDQARLSVAPTPASRQGPTLIVNPPRAADGGGDFSQDFFGRETFLTVSGQLNAEAYCLALSRVYTFGPTFRAENSNTSRHLAEFWMAEPETAFADLHANASLAEALLKFIFQAVL